MISMPKLVTVLGVCLALTGCASQGAPVAPDPPSTTPGIRLPAVHSSDARYLYHHFEQRLFSYDTAAGRIEEASTEANYFQYAFPTTSDLYTTGSSTDGGFSIIRVADRDISTVLTMSADQGVFPVATDGRDVAFFLVTTYTNGAETDRALARLVDGRLLRYPKVTGLVETGVVIGTTLIYSELNADSGSYTAKSIPVDDPDRSPRTVAKNLSSGRLYLHDGDLYFADKRSIYAGKKRFACADLCFFDDARQALIRIRVSDQDLVLDIIDTRSGSVVDTVPGGLDFTVGRSGIQVYTPTGITTVRLPQ